MRCAQLKETLVNLRATEAEGQRIAVERDQMRVQNESLSSTLHETKRSFIREQEAKAREFDEKDRSRQEHIEELEKNLKVLYGSDERARELEHYNQVMMMMIDDARTTTTTMMVMMMTTTTTTRMMMMMMMIGYDEPTQRRASVA